jgi:hypothetical protein
MQFYGRFWAVLGCLILDGRGNARAAWAQFSQWADLGTGLLAYSVEVEDRGLIAAGVSSAAKKNENPVWS